MLKGLIKQALEDAGGSADSSLAFSPRTTSLTVARASASRDSAEERFFKALEGQVDKASPVFPRGVGSGGARTLPAGGRAKEPAGLHMPANPVPPHGRCRLASSRPSWWQSRAPVSKRCRCERPEVGDWMVGQSDSLQLSSDGLGVGSSSSIMPCSNAPRCHRIAPMCSKMETRRRRSGCCRCVGGRCRSRERQALGHAGLERRQPSPAACSNSGRPAASHLTMQEAKTIGDEFLQLEKYVNLNYMVRGPPRRSLGRGLCHASAALGVPDSYPTPPPLHRLSHGTTTCNNHAGAAFQTHNDS